MNITNDVITEYIKHFYRPLTGKLADFRKRAEEEGVPIILQDTETVLVSIICALRPRRILEIGTAVGYSASVFAAACKNCRITTLESNENKYSKAVSNIERLGYSNRIEVIKGDASKTLDDMANRAGCGKEAYYSYDMVFIDAAKSHYKDYFNKALKLCVCGAIIVSNNVLLKGATASNEYDPSGRYKTSIRRMRNYLKHITCLDGIYTSVIPAGDGITISVLQGD